MIYYFDYLNIYDIFLYIIYIYLFIYLLIYTYMIFLSQPGVIQFGSRT